MEIKKYHTLLFLFALALGSSLVLSLIPLPAICDPGKGCDVVQHSVYAYTLGISNNYYGVIAFGILTAITLSHMQKRRKWKKNIIHLGTILGAVAAFYFLYIQHYILNAYCKYCVVIDFSIIIALGIVILKWKE